MTERPWTCAEVEGLLFPLLRGELEARAEARALAHIATCDACERSVQRWQAWQEALVHALAVPLTPDHAAALTDAIMNVEAFALPTPVRPSFVRYLVPISAAAALFLVFPRPLAVVLVTQPAVLGEVAADGVALEATDVTLGKVSMKLSKRGCVRVEQSASASAVLRLERGSVELEVAPLGFGQELRACTELSCVRVIGTHFSLQRGRNAEADTITVARGIVAVSHAALPDTELVLHSGESFTTPWHHAARGLTTMSDDDEMTFAAASAKAVAVFNGDAEAWIRLAESALARGDSSAARRAFDKVVHGFPTHPLAAEAMYAAAITTIDTGEQEQGMQRLRSYLERYPHGVFVQDAQWQLGTTALKCKKNEEAGVWLSRVMSGATSSARRAEAAFLLAGMREENDLAAAIGLYERVLEGGSADLQQKAKARLSELR